MHARSQRWYFVDSCNIDKNLLKLIGFMRMSFFNYCSKKKSGGCRSAALNYDFELTLLTCSFHHLTIRAMRRINVKRSISITPPSVIFHSSVTKRDEKCAAMLKQLYRRKKSLVAKAYSKHTVLSWDVFVLTPADRFFILLIVRNECIFTMGLRLQIKFPRIHVSRCSLQDNVLVSYLWFDFTFSTFFFFLKGLRAGGAWIVQTTTSTWPEPR